MRIKNTSRYPDDEVAALVRFAAKGINLTRVAVHVKNATGKTYRGMAYQGVPFQSPRSRQKTVDRLITLGIGTDFPSDNMVTDFRWRTYHPNEDGTFGPYLGEGDPSRWRYRSQYRDNKVVRVDVGIPYRHPYGGQRSPLIVVNDWREALVVVAAHEARHMAQHARGKPASEVDAERFAAKRLEAYRETT